MFRSPRREKLLFAQSLFTSSQTTFTPVSTKIVRPSSVEYVSQVRCQFESNCYRNKKGISTSGIKYTGNYNSFISPLNYCSNREIFLNDMQVLLSPSIEYLWPYIFGFHDMSSFCSLLHIYFCCQSNVVEVMVVLYLLVVLFLVLPILISSIIVKQNKFLLKQFCQYC